MLGLWFALEIIFTPALAQPVVLGPEPVTFPLLAHDDQALRKRLLEAVRSAEQNVVLVLRGVTAEARPEGSWEVHVEPTGAAAKPGKGCLVGIVSMYDRGSESAEFAFVLDDVLAAAGTKGLQVRFVPTSGVEVAGKPQPVDIRSTVKIGQIGLAIDSAGR